MTCFRMPNGETVRHYCFRNNITYGTIYKRLDDGMSLENALKPYKKGYDRNVKYTYKGKSLASILTYNSTGYRCAVKLIKNGYPVEKALEISKSKKPRVRYKYFYKGRRVIDYFPNQSRKYRRFIRLIHIKNMSVEEAFERVLNDVF